MRYLVVAMCLWISVPPLRAGGTEGAAPFNFLFLDAGARPAALGGAYAAAANDADALLYNPAGLAGIKQNHATLQHTGHFQGAAQEYGALALKQGFGFMFNTVGYGKIRRTTLSNPGGTGLDDFGIRDWAVSLGYGKNHGPVSLGIAGKYITEEIDDYGARALAMDIGALADLGPKNVPLSLGLAVQNIGTRAKFQSAYEELPVNIRMGLAYQFSGPGLLVVDANLPKHGGATIHAGGEYVIFERLALRIGYNGRNEAGPGLTAGGGVRFDGFSLDYAFVSFGDLGDSHRVSLSCRW
jgi:hypothetical protein